MSLKNLQNNWNALGLSDPKWAILTDAAKKGNKWENEAFFKTGDDRIKRTLQKIRDLDQKLSFDKALDFGCGIGRLSQALTKHFKDVTGVDISESMIKSARNIHSENGRLSFLHNTKENLEFLPSDSFDFIISLITLQHIPVKSTLKYIEEFARVLKPNGVAVFQMPYRLLKITADDSVLVKLKKNIESLFPHTIRDKYYHVLSRITGRPYMRMYDLPISRILETLQGHNIEILKVNRLELDDYNMAEYYIKKH